MRRSVAGVIPVLLVLVGLLATAQGGLARELAEADLPLLWNAIAKRADCPDASSYAWVDHEHGVECIRYFASEGLEWAPVAIVQFYGDRDRSMKKAPEDIRNNTRRAQDAYAASRARSAGTPVVVIARPGTYGSSGNHRERRQAKEFHSLDAALDVIKKRYGVGSFVLFGHSGGATAAAALLTLGRVDIRCAVLTSGAFSFLERARILREAAGKPPRPGRDTTGLPEPYDPLDHVDRIPADPGRVIYVLGNPDDSVTPFALQREFARALERAGHQVRLEIHPAAAPAFHNLRGTVGLKKAAECASAKADR